MRRIIYVVLSLLISLNAYCQRRVRGFYIKKFPQSASQKVLHLNSKADSIGIIVKKNWYKISKNISDKQSFFCRVDDYDSGADTISVYTPDGGFSFKLILTPFQRDIFEKNTQYMHASHMSHSSHHSHYSGI